VITATVIPAQQLTTTTDTYVDGHADSSTDATRSKTDTFGYLVDGKLTSKSVESSQIAERNDDCFEKCGKGTVTYKNVESRANNCDCHSFDNEQAGCDADCLDDFECVDPDQDIEDRINVHIRQSISDVLSQIVETAICGSMKHVIDLDDNEQTD